MGLTQRKANTSVSMSFVVIVDTVACIFTSCFCSVIIFDLCTHVHK